MNLRKKIIGVIVIVLIVITNIAVFAQTEKKPQTTLAVEPKRTEAGIEYNLYLEKMSEKQLLKRTNALTYCIQLGIPTTGFL